LSAFRLLDAACRWNLLKLFSAGLLFWASLTCLLPTLPLYIQFLGGSSQQVGVVIGGFAIGLLLVRPRLGRMADQQGRKRVIQIGMAVATIAPLTYLVTPVIPLLFGLRAFHGISVAAFTTAYSALVADLAPAKVRGEIIGIMSLCNPIGMALGPALGSWLQETWGYPVLFLVSAGLGLLGWGMIASVDEPDRESLTVTGDTAFWSLLRRPEVLIPALMLLLVGLAFGTLMTFLPLYLKSANTHLSPGLFYSAAALASFSTRVLAGPASDRLGRGLFISLSLAIYGTSLWMLHSSQTETEFIVAAIVEGAGFGMLIPMVISLISDRFSAQERGRAFGLCLGGLDLGGAIASPVMGSLALVTGYRPLFAIGSGLTFAALLLFMTQSSGGLRPSLRFATGQAKDGFALPIGRQSRSV
jgi:MFS family permease